MNHSVQDCAHFPLNQQQETKAHFMSRQPISHLHPHQLFLSHTCKNKNVHMRPRGAQDQIDHCPRHCICFSQKLVDLSHISFCWKSQIRFPLDGCYGACVKGTMNSIQNDLPVKLALLFILLLKTSFLQLSKLVWRHNLRSHGSKANTSFEDGCLYLRLAISISGQNWCIKRKLSSKAIKM